MNKFLKMDIFFFVTTVVVYRARDLFGVCAWQLGRVLKNIAPSGTSRAGE